MSTDFESTSDFGNIAALRASTLQPSDSSKAFVAATKTTYDWDSASTAADDGYLVIKQTNTAIGRWVITSTYYRVWAKYHQTSGQAFNTTGREVIVGNTLEIDTHLAYDTITGNFTVPIAGDYLVSAKCLQAINLYQMELYTSVNGVHDYAMGRQTASYAVNGTYIHANCVAGDLISISLRIDNPSSLWPDLGYSWVDFRKL